MNRTSARSGFALPAVLVVVAMLALVFLSTAGAMRSLTGEALAARRGVAFEQAGRSLEARAAWLAATEPSGEAAILVGGPRPESRSRLDASISRRREVVPLFLDGRPYRTEGPQGPLVVSVQDAAGQLNLNMLSDEGRVALTAALGAPPRERAPLAERWGDWIDIDDLVRLGGAEASAYRARGLAQPRDGPMTRTSELLGVLGWRAATPRSAWAALRNDLTVDPLAAGFNVNTASAAALRIELDLSESQARAVVEARERAPIVSVADLSRVTGPMPYDTERGYTRPDGRLSLSMSAPGSKLVFRSRIVLTPQHPERPFWIEERAVSSAAQGSDAPADAPEFPEPWR